MFRFIPIVWLFALTTLLWMSCGTSPDTVGKVGNEKISLSEFRDYLAQRKPNQTFEQIPFDQKKSDLTNLLEGRLKYLKARDLGLDKKPEFIEEFNRRQDRAIAGKLPETLIADKLVTPEKTRAFFNLQNSKTQLTVIALGYDGSKLVQAQRSHQESMNLANELYRRIQQGEATTDLSAEFSDLPNIKEQRGIIDSYTPGTFDPELDIIIDREKEGRVTKPIPTRRGIFIVGVLNKEPGERPEETPTEFQRIKWQIYNKFYRQEGDSIYKDLTEKFKSDLGWDISEEGIAQFLSAIETWSKGPNPEDSGFTEEQRNIYLGKVGNVTVTAGYLVNEFQGTFRSSYTRFNSPETMKQLVDDYISRFLTWVIEARRRNIENLPEVREQLEKFKHTKLVELYDQYEIRDKAIPDSGEVAAYYQENQSKYNDPEKIKMWEIALNDEATARKVLARARKPGADFAKLAQEYTEKRGLKNRGGDLGYQSKHSPRLIVKEAFSAGPNKIIGPIPEDKFFYIVKTGDIQPERQKELTEVEMIVKSALQREKENELQQEIRDKLKMEYTLWINENLLKKHSQENPS